MKKTNLVKVVSILLVSLMVILFSTNVFAAENNDTSFQDLTGTLGNSTENNTSKNTNANNANKNGNNTNANNANKNGNNTNTNNANANKNNNTNNSSIYNNTDLPKTGVESSIPVVVLVAIFGISAVYAYKKIDDYKNL